MQPSALDLEYFEHEFVGVDFDGRNLLEVGFGEGKVLAWARDHGAAISGIEVNPWSCTEARRAGVRLFDAIADAPDEEFDVVIAFDVFEHLDKAELGDYLTACARALRPGGFLCLRYPNGQSPLGRHDQYGDGTHKLVLSRAIVEHAAIELPLTTVRYGGTYRAHGSGAKRLKRVAKSATQDILQSLVRAAYGADFLLAPNVIHIMRKTA
jgi:2-polyprenyl-3-methyl-5-hydroxy-6-metoxy-1,4-benzoquinol methylase